MGQRCKEGMLRPGDNSPEKKDSEDFTILDVSDYEPPRAPSKTWRELIKKVWEVDPLTCPQYGSEMPTSILIWSTNLSMMVGRGMKSRLLQPGNRGVGAVCSINPLSVRPTGTNIMHLDKGAWIAFVWGGCNTRKRRSWWNKHHLPESNFLSAAKPTTSAPISMAYWRIYSLPKSHLHSINFILPICIGLTLTKYTTTLSLPISTFQLNYELNFIVKKQNNLIIFLQNRPVAYSNTWFLAYFSMLITKVA